MELVDLCQNNDFAVDVFKDQSGAMGLAVFVTDQFHFLINDQSDIFAEILKKIFESGKRVAIYDCRKLRQLGVEPRDIRALHDVRIIYGGEKTVFQLAKEFVDEPTYRELLELDQRFSSHIRACKIAKVDVQHHSLLRLIPGKFIQKMLKLKCHVTLRLLQRAIDRDPREIERWLKDVRPFFLALLDIEKNKIKVDEDFISDQLMAWNPSHVQSFLRGMWNMTKDGYLATRFNPVGSSTGRIRVDGSEGKIFQCMSVPHGACRQAIVSRYAGGTICSIDLNAIDYRCIVASVDDPFFKSRYQNAKDFHMVNCGLLIKDTSQVTEEIRKSVKVLTYISIYGGSPETAAAKSGMSLKNVQRALAIFDRELAPIHEFREKLHEKSRRDEYVVLPGGRKIFTQKSDHAGKVIGLYAQGYASWMFERALIRATELMSGKKSKILFPVHDELIIDVHPEEQSTVPSMLLECFEQDGLVASLAKGKNYRECTD